MMRSKLKDGQFEKGIAIIISRDFKEYFDLQSLHFTDIFLRFNLYSVS